LTEFKVRHKVTSEKYNVTFIAQDLFNGYKGLKTLLKCIEEFSEEFKSENIVFNFIGSGPNINIGELKNKQIALVREETLTDILLDSDLLIVPSLTDNSPNVIFEALVCGVPFVCSDLAGLPELAVEFGMNTFNYGNSKSIFDAIVKQKSSNVIPQNLRKHALEMVSPEIVARTVAKIYQDILEDHESNL
jgi:glycosyltransferase involved in cell wall biosynthesis